MKVYNYTDDSWWDGDLPCECYNAQGWSQNGSASSLWNLYVDAIVAHKAEESGEDYHHLAEHSYYLYEGFTLGDLLTLCERLGIVLEEVSL